MEQQDLLSNDLYVSPPAQQYLLASARWGKFLSIVGFIGCGLMILVGSIIAALPSASEQFRNLPISSASIGVIYIVCSVIFIFPCLYLYKFSTKMRDAIINTRQDSFDSSLENMKSMFKFYGIFTIVTLGLYVIAIVAIMVGVMSHR